MLSELGLSQLARVQRPDPRQLIPSEVARLRSALRLVRPVMETGESMVEIFKKLGKWLYGIGCVFFVRLFDFLGVFSECELRIE